MNIPQDMKNAGLYDCYYAGAYLVFENRCCDSFYIGIYCILVVYRHTSQEELQ